MAFKMVFLPENVPDEWIRRVRESVPGCDARLAKSNQAALKEIVDADAAYGAVTPELLGAAKKLRWIQAPAAAPPIGYY
ncbi:MAG: D-2-hydroxyacid dehydrogenase, partial [Chloroflexota bacterium]|nr:D-2-hydroxyacid dehydrogenase [Chloroflexota bacterium]